MNLKELGVWAKEIKNKKNNELLQLGVPEQKIDKGRGTLEMIHTRVDEISAFAIKQNRYMDDIEGCLNQLKKWGFPIPGAWEIVPPIVNSASTGFAAVPTPINFSNEKKIK